MPTLATEKTTNYIFRPVLKTRPKKQFPYRLEPVDEKKDGLFMIDKYWTAKHHMMLDVLTNELLDGFQKRETKGDIITSHFSDIVKKEAKNIKVDDLRYFAHPKNYEQNKTQFKERIKAIDSELFTLHEKGLAKKYPFLSKMTSGQICQLLKGISETRFKCAFRVKVLTDSQKSFTHYKYYMWAPEPLFSVDEKILEQTRHEPPKVKLRNYIIEFGGIVGRLFAHNVKALNVIRMPVEFYSLSQDAQFIYRRFIGTMVIAKGQSKSSRFIIEQEAVERYMDMKVAHSTYKRKRVSDALNELKSAGLIEFKMMPARRHDYIMYEVVRCS